MIYVHWQTGILYHIHNRVPFKKLKDAETFMYEQIAHGYVAYLTYGY